MKILYFGFLKRKSDVQQPRIDRTGIIRGGLHGNKTADKINQGKASINY